MNSAMPLPITSNGPAAWYKEGGFRPKSVLFRRGLGSQTYCAKALVAVGCASH